MPDSAIQRNIYTQDADPYIGGLACVYATQGNEYGYSYYWWYYGIPTSNRHALAKRD